MLRSELKPHVPKGSNGKANLSKFSLKWSCCRIKLHGVHLLLFHTPVPFGDPFWIAL